MSVNRYSRCCRKVLRFCSQHQSLTLDSSIVDKYSINWSVGVTTQLWELGCSVFISKPKHEPDCNMSTRYRGDARTVTLHGNSNLHGNRQCRIQHSLGVRADRLCGKYSCSDSTTNCTNKAMLSAMMQVNLTSAVAETSQLSLNGHRVHRVKSQGCCYQQGHHIYARKPWDPKQADMKREGARHTAVHCFLVMSQYIKRSKTVSG